MSGRNRAQANGVAPHLLQRPAGELWDRMEGEPGRWYARFEVYRSLGPNRCMMAAYRECAAREGLKAIQPDANWYQAFRKWSWDARAYAWDVVEREETRAKEKQRRFATREGRLELFDTMLTSAVNVLERANLEALTQDEARKLLSKVRLLLKDAFTLQGKELDRLDERDAKAEALEFHFCADDFRRAQLELDAWRAGQAQEQAPTAIPPAAPLVAPLVAPLPAPGPIRQGLRMVVGLATGELVLDQTLLVCTGPEAHLLVDVTALRAVKTTTGLAFHRIVAVTRVALDNYLHRQEIKGRPVRLMHLAVCPAPGGVHFADGIVSGAWLRERLANLQLLLLSGLEGPELPEWAREAPMVITIDDALAMPDAAAFTLHFWSAIGRGWPPEAALDDALAHCAPAVRGCVTQHW